MTSPDADQPAREDPDRREPRRLVSVDEGADLDAPDASDVSDGSGPPARAEDERDEVATLQEALARALRRAERERDKRAASVARAEKAASRLGDVKAELRKARKATEKSAAKLQREHDARERAEQGRAEWKQRAKSLADELQAIREALTLHETRLETATIEVEELRAELRQATHDQRAAVDEAARLREQLLRLHTELGRVLPARYLRRLGLG